MAPEFAFVLRDVTKLYPPDKYVVRDINLSFYYGAKIGVLGFNGSGKTTLLNIIAGKETEIKGEVLRTKGLSFGYLEQEPELDETLTVREVVNQGVAHIMALLDELNDISVKMCDASEEEMAKLSDRMDEVQQQIDASDGWEVDHLVETTMSSLGLPPGDRLVKNLSGGEKRRVALCRLVLSKPDVLLLDEPTNHLDAASVLWLEHFLNDYPGTVVAVTHDRFFLDNSAEWILELDRGRGIPWKGNYSSWLEQKSKRLELEEKEKNKRVKTLSRELEWIRSSPKARQAKSKARINAYNELVSQDVARKFDEMEIYIPPGPRLGEHVINLNNISKAYDDKVLFKDLNLKIPRGAIIGVIGVNGAGKTTLFRILTGEVKPDAGEVEIGDTVSLAYVDQSRQTLSGSNPVWVEIAGGNNEFIEVGGQKMNSRAYAARFSFSGSDQQKEVGVLSGGERNRVHLAKLLRSGGNVLLLDEPTNDLDVNTLRALEEAILEFSGCVVVISHDRWFLERVATHMIAFEGNGEVKFFEGTLTEYEEDRKRRAKKA